MMRRLSVLGAVVVLAGALLLADVGTAVAQTNLDASIPVTGTGTATNPALGLSQGVWFEGTVDLRRFSARGDDLFMVGTLSGAFTAQFGVAVSQDDHTVARISDEPARVRVTRIESSCEQQVFRIMLNPASIDAEGMAGDEEWQVDLDALFIEFAADQDASGLGRVLLCQASDLVGTNVDLSGGDLPVPAATVARVLNQLVRLWS